MSDERRDERLDRIASEAVRREYGDAEAPREAIWAAIEADRRTTGSTSRPPLPWVVALATAAIVVAVVFGVSRYAVDAPAGDGPVVRRPTVETTPVDSNDLILRGHLGRTGALLDTLAAGEAARPADAAPLLARTRALLGDPALDPTTMRLLADAEVALALLVRSNGTNDSVERDALRETVADGQLATRLLAASGRTP